MICEAARIGILLFNLPASLIHQQPVQYVLCLTNCGRDILSGKWAELIRDMRIGLQARFGAIFCIDEIHRFALPGGGEELPITRCGDTAAQCAAIGKFDCAAITVASARLMASLSICQRDRRDS